MDRILRASALLALSSVVVAASSALRYKFVALELGSAGVGRLSVLISASTVAVTLASLGLGSSGVRAVAASRDDPKRLAAVRYALFRATLISGPLGALLATVTLMMWAGPWFKGLGESRVLLVAMCAAVTAGVWNTAQVAWLNGANKLRQMAAGAGIGGIAGTGVAIAAVLLGSTDVALAAALCAVPLATLVANRRFVQSSTSESLQRSTARGPWVPELRQMALLGAAVTTGLVVGAATQFVTRIWLQSELGVDGVGEYHAAWAVSSLYLAFVLGALAAEYFPRLSSLEESGGDSTLAVTRQITISLSLATPIVLWLIILAPTVLTLLYSKEFVVSTDLLRWQLAGDLLKIPGWTIGFLFLARGMKWAIVVTELVWNVAFLALLMPLTRELGLEGAGIAYGLAYLIYLALCIIWARRTAQFRLTKAASGIAAFHFAVAGSLLWLLRGHNGGAIAAWPTAVALVATIVCVLTVRALGRQTDAAQ